MHKIETTTAVRTFRFTLRSFLLATLGVGIVLGAIGNFLLHVRKERAVASELLSRGIDCSFEYDYLGNTTAVGLTSIYEAQRVPVNQKLVWPVDEDLSLLAEFPRLEALNLAGPEITDAGLAKIPQLNQLKSFGIRGGQVTSVGLRQLNPAKIEYLSLEDMRLDEDAMKVIGSFRNLRDLYIYRTTISPNGFGHLSSLVRLTRLELRSVGLTDEGCSGLAKLESLETLHLINNPLSDQGVGHLVGLSELRVLRIDDTQVGDGGLEKLKRLQSLQHLHIINTKVTDAGMRHFREMPNLSTIDLQGTEVTDKGIRELHSVRGLRNLLVGPHVTEQAAKDLRRSNPLLIRITAGYDNETHRFKSW